MALKIYADCLQMVREVGALVRVIEKRDADLARQLRRSAASVVLNTCEGAYSDKGNERARWKNALGSAAETRAALECAVAFGYVLRVDAATHDRLDKIVATLFKLTR